MNILVTGGAGFIASHIVDAYLERGHSVTVVDDLSVGKMEMLNPRADFYQIDITDKGKLSQLFRQRQFDVVNHHAAQKFLRRSIDFPEEDATINIIGSINLLDLAARNGCKQFIFASTAAVYGDIPSKLPYAEGAAGGPIAPYGAAKFSVEKYMYAYSVNFDLTTTVLRYSNVYGPRQDAHGESGVIAIFTEKLLANEAPMINGDGTQRRDYVYVSDVVRANVLALDMKNSDVMNISTGTEVDLLTLVSHLEQLTGVLTEPVFGEAKKGDPSRVVLDNRKAQEVLGWSPKFSIEQGLHDTVEWFSLS